MDVHEDMHERDDKITREKIVPLVTACRENGMRIIHAPAPPIARRHPNWTGPAEEPVAEQPDWPPPEFIQRRGPYAAFASPEDPLKFAAWKLLDGAEFHELVRPVGNEAVVATGEELHHLCAKEGILFLVYVGHHTPGCMTGRTYGVLKMRDRGYICILLRDCTNGMETRETFANQTSMNGTIAFLEQTGTYTLESGELITSLEQEKESKA